MASEAVRERIRLAASQAAAGLARANSAHTIAPGDLFVFDAGPDVGVEWLFVRTHPDDAGRVELVPVDDFPLIGSADVAFDPDVAGRPLAARCGQADGFPASLLAPWLRTGSLPADAVARVRGHRAGAASDADFDPEYEAWIEDVARAHRRLLALAEPRRVTFRDAPPAELVPTAGFQLAAASGGLAGELAAALTDGRRFAQVPDVPGGQLLLVAKPAGVHAVWVGPIADAPVLAAGEPLAWQSGPQGGVHRTAGVVPWADGRAEVTVGGTPVVAEM